MIYKILLTVITAALALAAFLPMLEISEVLSEPFEQMRVYILLATAVFMLLSMITKFWITAGFHVLLIVMHTYVLLQIYPVSEAQTACRTSDRPITVMAYNIFYKNQNTNAIIATILAEDADIVALQEAKEPFLKNAYDKLSQKYAFSYPDISKDPFFSPAIFSKYPIKVIKQKKLPISAVRIPHATLDVDGQSLELISIHAISPKNVRTIKKRNMFIQDLANYAQNMRYEGKKFIIAGDFNSVPWHPKMVALQKQGGVIANLSLWNYFGTWPNWGAPLFSVPIDHIFSSQGIKKISYKKVSHSAGSDHFPIKSTLNLCK